jgi:hypothetical protein
MDLKKMGAPEMNKTAENMAIAIHYPPKKTMTEQLTVVYIHISENCREAGPTLVLFSSKGSTATGLCMVV